MEITAQASYTLVVSEHELAVLLSALTFASDTVREQHLRTEINKMLPILEMAQRP